MILKVYLLPPNVPLETPWNIAHQNLSPVTRVLRDSSPFCSNNHILNMKFSDLYIP